MTVVSIIITPEIEDFNHIIEWAEQNCHSFDKYRLIELSDESRNENPLSWFELEFHFRDGGDATLFALRWS
jgi:hypothetical protein